MMDRVKVVGAGLAGCEAAWQLAKRGVDVDLYEMKPGKMSPAHHSPLLPSWYVLIPCGRTGSRTPSAS